MEIDKYEGPERRKAPPIHPWRWRALSVWIVVFTLFTIYAWHSVSDSRAKVRDLERTNCRVKIFLMTARHARLQAARQENGDARRSDLASAASYQRLADTFGAVGNCVIPREVRD